MYKNYIKKIDKNSPIGIFDSGVGGLTVFSEIKRILPSESLIYFGDTARVPYGPKSKPVIERYSREIVNFLMSNSVKMVVIACNTSTAVVEKEFSNELPIPVIGVIEPACRLTASISINGKIGVIGTKGTINSKEYYKKLKLFNEKFEIYQKPCPLFVPLAEEGWTEGEVADSITRTYLQSLKEKEIDTIILGCTHYPILRKTIEKFLGENINIIDSATQTALSVKARLKELNLLSDKKNGEYSFNCSDSPEHFMEIGNRFLNFEIDRVKRVKVWEYSKII